MHLGNVTVPDGAVGAAESIMAGFQIELLFVSRGSGLCPGVGLSAGALAGVAWWGRVVARYSWSSVLCVILRAARRDISPSPLVRLRSGLAGRSGCLAEDLLFAPLDAGVADGPAVAQVCERGGEITGVTPVLARP